VATVKDRRTADEENGLLKFSDSFGCLQTLQGFTGCALISTTDRSLTCTLTFPIALTTVHHDGTSILSLHNIYMVQVNKSYVTLTVQYINLECY